MNIGDAIKQAKFENAHQKAMINLIYTHNWFKERLSAFLKNEEITSQQFNVLRILNGQYPEGITTGEIRARMLDKMSDASRLVDRLEKQGMVMKNRNPADRRLVTCVITDAGRALLQKIKLEEGSLYQPLTHNLTDKEASELSDLLDKMRG